MTNQALLSPSPSAPSANVAATDLENSLAGTPNFYVKAQQKCMCCDITFTYFKGTYASHDENQPIMTLTVPCPSIMQLIGCAQTSDMVCPAAVNQAEVGKLVGPPAMTPMSGGFPWMVFNSQRYVGKYTFGASCCLCEKIIKDHMDVPIYSEDTCCLIALLLQCYRNCCVCPIICPRIHLRTYKTKSGGAEAFSVFRVKSFMKE